MENKLSTPETAIKINYGKYSYVKIEPGTLETIIDIQN